MSQVGSKASSSLALKVSRATLSVEGMLTPQSVRSLAAILSKLGAFSALISFLRSSTVSVGSILTENGTDSPRTTQNRVYLPSPTKQLVKK